MNVKALAGSGDKIGLYTLPFVLLGVVLNLLFPAAFQVGGPPLFLQVLALLLLIPGATIWIWLVLLILTSVPQQHLITTGPYTLVKHPLYTGVALLPGAAWAGVALEHPGRHPDWHHPLLRIKTLHA
jgi:protein-S-isoprenylcysteine O-methyltransferase Ste14